ncbi:MAG TPA: APC family permease [Acidimicrobiales bacterium]|nr:APC family permease [Acidimicrobiales bacterium]
MSAISGIISTDAARAERSEKGLKGGALGLVASTVVGVASTAPAYSLASTLGFVVVLIGVRSPVVTLLAFVPMLLISVAYKELNRADPDCGTTFTWATRAFTPKVGWMGGWGIVAADILVMPSLAQIAGQYVFQLFGAKGIGNQANSGWVLLVGIGWIVAMTAICYVGIEISANFQKALLGTELVMLTVLSVVALVKVASGSAPVGHLVPAWSWLNPFGGSASSFVQGLALMLFIYWGWDTSVSVNEETANKHVFPGRAAVISTLVLLGIYEVVVTATQSYAGLGSKGIGLGNPAHQGDVLSVLGGSVFGTTGIGNVLTKLLLLMVLTSAAASTQTTILPTARTTLSMAVYRSIPSAFARIHKRFLTPTVSTVAMGAASIVLYVILNYVSANSVISDSVTALGVMIAFYYGLTGLSCAWYYRRSLSQSARSLFMRGILPLLGWAIMWSIGGYSLVYDWSPANSYSSWRAPLVHWQMGGSFVLAAGSLLIGVVLMFVYRPFAPAFFKGITLNAGTETLVPEDVGAPVGLFGIEPETELVGPGSPPVLGGDSGPGGGPS